ncbi:hypothetical protein D3C87_1487800 [compost metagenome]
MFTHKHIDLGQDALSGTFRHSAAEGHTITCYVWNGHVEVTDDLLINLLNAGPGKVLRIDICSCDQGKSRIGCCRCSIIRLSKILDQQEVTPGTPRISFGLNGPFGQFAPLGGLHYLINDLVIDVQVPGRNQRFSGILIIIV